MFDGIAWAERFIESSPVIVTVLIIGYGVAWRVVSLAVTNLIKRLDAKDEMLAKNAAQLMDMQHNTLSAIEEMRKAVDGLSEALRDANRHR